MTGRKTAERILFDTILPQLDKCREIPSGGKDRGWSACCPAHDDKSPSFSIALCHDGKILMHCYGGCSITEICFSLGVELQDLFPEESNWKPERYDPSLDELVIKIGDSDMAKGKALSQVDRQRYRDALQRINNNIPSPKVDKEQVRRNHHEVSKREAERTKILMGDIT